MPVVKFNNQKGESVTETLNSGRASKRLQGKSILLYYNPDNTKDTLIDSIGNYVLICVFLLIGISALIILALGLNSTFEWVFSA